MDRWCGIVRANLNPNTTNRFTVAASLCLSSSSKTLTVPSANAVFFTGDQVKGSRNPVIERLSNPQNIAQLLVSKFAKIGVCSVNVWVVEPATLNGPFAVYGEFIPTVNARGDPESYVPDGFPASTNIALLLSKCLEQVKQVIGGNQKTPQTKVCASPQNHPKTIIFGFSKGGTVLNQLVTELAYIKRENSSNLSATTEGSGIQEENQTIPSSKETLLNSISEIHYVDVGLNSAGAYLTDNSVIEKIVDRVKLGAFGVRFTLHGTPRQWCDTVRPWIANEKKILLEMLEDAAQNTAGRIEVHERFYFANMPPSMQMHFEIIEIMDLR